MTSIEARLKKISVGMLAVWVVAVANLLLIWLSWIPWFGGTAQHAGIVDKLLGHIRFGGFRADFVWLCLSTVALFLAALFFILRSRTSRDARISAALCAAAVLSFVLYIWHALFSGVLDFG
jgi:hypothetical protein